MMEFPSKSNLPEDRRFCLRGLGGNGVDLTVEAGDGSGATLVRTGEGVYKIVLPFNPGDFKKWSWALGAATPANLLGYTVVRDTPDGWNNTTKTWSMPFTVGNASNAAADLIADEYIDLELTFGMAE